MGGVFDNVIRKGELGGFGLENIGNVSKLNGTVKLAESFTPTELSGQRRQPVQDEEFEDEEFEDEEFEERPEPEPPQPKFFGDVNENSSPDFFGKVPQQREQAPEKIPNFFPSQNKATSGIPKQTDFFGNIPKPKSKTPLIGNLKEGVQFFDDAFTRDGQKAPLKRGTGFDNFVGTINIEKLSRGKPDSAVPLRGVFAKKRTFSNRPVDLSQMNRRTGVLPNPEGFENFNVEESIEAFNEVPDTGKRKAGRPKGSLGKKKRIAKKITKTSNKVATKGKRKKKSELSKARRSLLKEQNRLQEGGAPRNQLQSNSFSSSDNSFKGLFT